MEEKNKSPKITPKKRGNKQNLMPAWKPGQSGNPKGYPRGMRNFSTLFNEAIKKITTDKKVKIGDPEMEIVTKAVKEALKGNYNYYKDIMDRKYGKAKEQMDINFKAKELKAIEDGVRSLVEMAIKRDKKK